MGTTTTATTSVESLSKTAPATSETKTNPSSDSNGGGSNQQRWEVANYTWRGRQAKNQGGYAKYQGRGQRIDYFLLSPSKLCSRSSKHKEESTSVSASTSAPLATRDYDGDDDDDSDNKINKKSFVESCDILGYGT